HLYLHINANNAPFAAIANYVFQQPCAHVQHAPRNESNANLGSDDEEDGDEEEEGVSKMDDLDLLNAQDIAYSIRQLLRGLASPRESRLGFAVALTE
ncbi:hypothetical protein H0H92_013622, partial [Tricholoma furcatifolium]